MVQKLIGRVTYYVTWPGLFLLLLSSQRTRVLIICGDEVLLAKSWLGNGQWHLLGGGLNHGEDPAAGACREIFEEVGIRVRPAELTFLFQAWTPKKHGFRYRYFAYALELPKKPELMVDAHEIADTKWFPIQDAPATTGSTLQQVHDAWQNKG